MAVPRKAYTFEDVLLVPKYSVLRSRFDADVSAQLTPKIRLANPLVAASMDTVCEAQMAITLGQLGGVGVLHRFNTVEEQAAMVRKVKKSGVLVGAAVGVREADVERARALIEAGVDFLDVDIAHGHSKNMGAMLKLLRKRFPSIELIAGNVATADAAAYLIEHGAAAVKVGIGPGSTCTTRIVSGFGVPQLSAIFDTAKDALRHRKPIMADGGISSSGALVKALAAGASTVMLGNMLAGTDESPGKVIRHKDGRQYKEFRGMASSAARAARAKKADEKIDPTQGASEGVAGLVPYKGSVLPIIEQLLGGLRSGISYAGARNISELQANADFVEITASGWRESNPHDISAIRDS